MRYLTSLCVAFLFAASLHAQQEIPKAADPRLVVELVAQAPDIVHPISCDFDHKGRLLVIESHTHFAPKDYKGPKFDRIRMIDPSLGARARKFTTFFEGTRHTMDIAVHPDGSVYLATRNEILRLRETKDGVKSERIVFLDTKGDYPHNGLSGLCFDSKGDLTFGMGENLGVFFKLIGTDGTTITDEQGGHIFHCTADGKKLRRVATGFWNPFGICRDIYGRTFCVDNDPDQSPPCRMVHVVEGGDYGFRFCYGRSGKHPFQSWHGTLPGTLPMMTGVGEAPCEILSYESDGLPKEYLGKLMVTSWADHRVELYKVVPHGASFKAERQPFVQGGNNFRPVGMCVAPDGSIYITDWVLSNYNLHGKGAIWHIRWKDAPKVERPTQPEKAIHSMHRPLREAAAQKLASHPIGRKMLDGLFDKAEVRVSAAALTALIDINARELSPQRLTGIVKLHTEFGMRELALQDLVERRELKVGIITEKSPLSLQALAIPSLSPGISMYPKEAGEGQPLSLFGFFKSSDPFIRHAAVLQYGRSVGKGLVGTFTTLTPGDPKVRIALMLATPHKLFETPGRMDAYLNDSDEDVRFLTVKWIADDKLAKYRKDVEKLMADPKLSVRMYLACATALARIDGKDVNEKTLADYFAKRLADDATPPAQRAMLLRQVPATHPKLTFDLFHNLTRLGDAGLTFEAVRATVDHPGKWGAVQLGEFFIDPANPRTARLFATLGMIVDSEKKIDEWLGYAEGPFHDDILRMLVGVKLTKKQREYLEDLERDHKSPEVTRRVLDKPFFKDRPPAKDLDAWMKRLEGKADPDAGARVFFHPKLAGCYKCHRIDGRGADVGPDLSSIGRVERRSILESILQPSNTVAPHYVAWHLETAAGKVKSGMLIHTQLDEYTFLDAKGEKFKVRTSDLVEQRPLATSIMPDGLVDRLTDQEVRDLLAYLQSRK